MRTIQIIRALVGLLLGMDAGIFFFYATQSSETIRTIILSVFGTITALCSIMAVVLFIREYCRGFSFKG